MSPAIVLSGTVRCDETSVTIVTKLAGVRKRRPGERCIGTAPLSGWGLRRRGRVVRRKANRDGACAMCGDR